MGQHGQLQDDLSQYSTTIDVAKLPEKQRKKAERVAKEIELRQCCRGGVGHLGKCGRTTGGNIGLKVVILLECRQDAIRGIIGDTAQLLRSAQTLMETSIIENCCLHKDRQHASFDQ